MQFTRTAAPVDTVPATGGNLNTATPLAQAVPGGQADTHGAAHAAHARYPVQWIDRWALPGGKTVTVRPVLPQDDDLALDFVATRMSTRSRYQRFMMGLRVLPASMARYLTDIDYRTHFALIVETFDNAGQQQVAEARFVRADDSRMASAEFAIAVADAWQGLGLGRRLLKTTITAAASQGIETLYGDVLRDNPAMLQLARSCGFEVSAHSNDARLLRAHRASARAPDAMPRQRRPAMDTGAFGQTAAGAARSHCRDSRSSSQTSPTAAIVRPTTSAIQNPWAPIASTGCQGIQAGARPSQTPSGRQMPQNAVM